MAQDEKKAFAAATSQCGNSKLQTRLQNRVSARVDVDARRRAWNPVELEQPHPGSIFTGPERNFSMAIIVGNSIFLMPSEEKAIMLMHLAFNEEYIN